MATSIALTDELYSQAVERARAEKTTPEEWRYKIVAERLDREDLIETTLVFSEEMRRKMAARGVKQSDVEREIADHRRGR